MDETKNELPIESGNTVDEALDSFKDQISDLALPDPIQKHFWKAVDRLFCALIEIPVQKLQEGPAERRAILEERTKFIRAVNAQNIQHIEADPEFAARASRSFTQKLLRERLNLESIFSYVVDIFRNKESGKSEGPLFDHEVQETINPDWFNIFEKEAVQKSTEEAQRRFARVLAGEIERPGSFSTRTLNVLGELDQTAAILFKRMCSMCMVLQDVPEPFRHIKLPTACTDGRKGWNYSMDVWQLHILMEYGLIVSRKPETWLPGIRHIENESQKCEPFWYQGKYWGLRRLPEWKDEKDLLPIGGISLTQVGKELFYLLKEEWMDSFTEHPAEGHAEALRAFFAERGLRMAEVQLHKELVTTAECQSYYHFDVEWF